MRKHSRSKKPEIGQIITFRDREYRITKIRTIRRTQIELTLDVTDNEGNIKTFSLETSNHESWNDPKNLAYFDKDDLNGWIKSEYD